MNIKVLDSWLRQYLQTTATTAQIQELLSLSGPAVERLTPYKQDTIYEFEITNNRIDLASVYGLARETRTILNHHGVSSQLKELEVTKDDHALPSLSLAIIDEQHLTKRLLAVVLEFPRLATTPIWMVDRLEAAGVRSLNYLIDVTNYVMLEVGHPLHVFDLDRLNTDKLVIRTAKDGESLITLDQQNHQLSPNDVVIADQTERIVDLPGIMGCANSVVTSETRRILLFAEVNDPVRIRRTSMRLAIRTLAASYNENAPDSALAYLGVQRAIKLYQQSGGKQVSQIFDHNQTSDKLLEVEVSMQQIASYMNTPIKEAEVVAILEDLDIKVKSSANGRLRFTIPSFRANDITIAQDLIEEVARIYGYGKLPTELPPFTYISDEFIRANDQRYRIEERLKEFLVDRGYFELYNYSMISEKLNNLFQLGDNSIKMVNPMSQELVCFRQSLVPSLVNNALINKGEKRLAIFEVANVYLPQKTSLPLEQPTLGIVLKGKYSELKGVIDALWQSGHLKVEYIPGANHSYLDRNQSARIQVNHQDLGNLGVLKADLLYQLGLKGDYCAAEISLLALAKHYRLQVPLAQNSHKNELIEDLTYKFEDLAKSNWQFVSDSLMAKFDAITSIDFVTNFDNKYITMRIYSEPNNGQSILPRVYEYLEQELTLEIKRPKDDSNKS